MRFLERAIKRGISRGVGDAIGKAVQQAIEPKANELANKAAQRLDTAVGEAAQTNSAMTSSLETAFSNLERAAQGYATQMGQNMKICPACGQPADANTKFCPSCGGKLPEQTLAQGALCPACGKQNTIGMKFCQDCGTKLPMAVQEEQAAMERDMQVMARWQTELSAFPMWNGGGSNLNIEAMDGYMMFSADFDNNYSARNAVEQYRALLHSSGFVSAGQYPSPDQLYKMIDGICFHADLEHVFDGDGNSPTLYFNIGEPTGGFNYVKPEPRKPMSFKDLFNL